MANCRLAMAEMRFRQSKVPGLASDGSEGAVGFSFYHRLIPGTLTGRLEHQPQSPNPLLAKDHSAMGDLFLFSYFHTLLSCPSYLSYHKQQPI